MSLRPTKATAVSTATPHSRIQRVLVTGQQQNDMRYQRTLSIRAFGEDKLSNKTYLMAKALMANNDILKWIQLHTQKGPDQRSAFWVLASAGRSKKEFLEALCNNVLFTDDEKKNIKKRESGFLYVLFPIAFAGRDWAERIMQCLDNAGILCVEVGVLIETDKYKEVPLLLNDESTFIKITGTNLVQIVDEWD
jgi:hypothetical protein